MPVDGWLVHRRIGMSGGLFTRAVAREIGRALTQSEAEELQRRHAELFQLFLPERRALRSRVSRRRASAVSRGETLYIRGMAVLPSARGQRIGELLLGQIQMFAVSQGCKKLLLSTTPFLARAIQLYEHSGFKKTDEGPHDLFGTPLFTMVKNLSNQ